jgi:Flp pilus assembly protein TadD
MTDSLSGIIHLARSLCADEKYTEAERVLRNALLSAPLQTDLHIELAVVLARVGNEQEAERVLRHVLSVDPRNERATSILGHLMDSALRTEEAEELYRSYIALVPNGHCVVDDLCRLLYSEGQVGPALTLAREHARTYANEYRGYDALRYVLNQIEDDNEFAADEGKGKARLIRVTAENLLEQYYLAGNLVRVAETQGLNQEVLCESEEELARVRAELAHLTRKAAVYSVRLSSQLDKRIQGILSGEQQSSH